MATGNIAGQVSGWAWRHFTLPFLLLGCFSVSALAQDVGLAGLMGSKAMLIVNGGEPQAVAIGQSMDGVKLLSIQGDQAVVEVGGKKRPLRVGQHAIGAPAADGSGKITMMADGQGHFFTTGTVNGTSVLWWILGRR